MKGKNTFILLILLIYSLIGYFLLDFYQYQINEDQISYISIAKKYLALNFKDAINAYWGPLISWLLIPFLYLKIPALYAFKVLLLIIGIFTIIGTYLLSLQFGLEKNIQYLILFSLIFIVLYFSFTLSTPDPLLTCILIFYLNKIFDKNYPANIYNGIFCGFLGSLSYLAKAYGFYFFLFHFFLFNIFHYLKTKNKNIALNFISCLIVFFIISGIWICLLSVKYKKFTISTIGRYAHACMGPKSKGHPMLYQGLFEPPNKTAISIWEDPSYIAIDDWNPFSSFNYFKYQIQSAFSGIPSILRIYEEFSIFSIFIIFGSIMFFSFKEHILYPLVTIFLYPIGILLVRTEPGKIPYLDILNRYFWLNNILLLLMGGYLLSILHFRFKGKIMRIITFFFILSFVVNPIRYLSKCHIQIDFYRKIYLLSKELKGFGVYGNVASNGNWGGSLYLCYYLDCKYLGISLDKDELKRHNTNFYFEWTKDFNKFYVINLTKMSNYTQ